MGPSGPVLTEAPLGGGEQGAILLDGDGRPSSGSTPLGVPFVRGVDRYRVGGVLSRTRT